MIDRATALPDAPSLRIQRIDGGWLVVLAGCDVPLACRTARQLIDDVRLFLGDSTPLPELSPAKNETPLGAICMVSKVDGGWLTTLIYGPQNNIQLVRFTPRDTTLVVIGWAGFVDASAVVASPPTPPSSTDETTP